MNIQLTSRYNGYEPVDTEEENIMLPRPRTKWFSQNSLAVASAVLALIGTAILLTTTTIPGGVTTTEILMSDSTTVNSINFTLKRKNYLALPYFDVNANALLKYQFLNKYLAVVEPYAPMEFHLFGKTTNDIEYSVCTSTGNCQKSTWLSQHDSSTNYLTFDCNPHDTFSLTATEVDAEGKTVNVVRGSAVCMYVRRETRKLTGEDLDKFIAASAVLNKLSDVEGMKKYGPTYMSSSTLVKMHHFNAVQRNQDHIHEGNGFLIQHLKMGNMFEAAVLAVDPSVAMPYWDFTIDESTGLTTNRATIFNKRMYGTNYQPKNITSGWTYQDDLIVNGRIMDGPWKDLKVEMNPYKGDEYVFGYGYMRSPWNLNPSPYVSRFPLLETDRAAWGDSYMPSCSDHYDILQYDDMLDFYYQISYNPHGTLHILEGGFYGCDRLDPLVEAGYITNKEGACYFWVFTLKELFRAGAISPNKNCVVKDGNDYQNSECGFTCPTTSTAPVWATINAMLRHVIDKDKEGAEQAFYDFICNGGDGGKIFPGDHLESASPADPSFWVIHPSLERLLHVKLLSGGFDNEGEWPTDSLKTYVCNKAACYDVTTGGRTTTDCCYGHYQDDRLYDGLVGDLATKFGPTNREVEVGTDPRQAGYGMNYVYDDFSWDHCSQDFSALFSDMHADALNRADGPDGRRAAARKVPRPASQEKVKESKRSRLQAIQAALATK